LALTGFAFALDVFAALAALEYVQLHRDVAGYGIGLAQTRAGSSSMSHRVEHRMHLRSRSG
jgi:hypothetical protein